MDTRRIMTAQEAADESQAGMAQWYDPAQNVINKKKQSRSFTNERDCFYSLLLPFPGRLEGFPGFGSFNNL